MIENLEIIDRAAGEPVLIFGSLPPDARDIDVLARGEAEHRIADALTTGGFIRQGHHFVRFHSCTADAVDLIGARSWNLSPTSLDELFDAAVPIDGSQNLRRPAPKHALLILARRLVRSTYPLPPKHISKVQRALEEDPDAWEIARSIAPEWNAIAALSQLRSLVTGIRPSRPERTRVIFEDLQATGAGAVRSLAGALRSPGRPSRRGVIVTLSGVDGSGKSSQGEALRTALERSGFDVTLEWTKIARDPSLDVIARPVKWMAGRLGSGRPDTVPATEEGDPARAFRRRSAAVTQAWTLIVALANSRTHRRATRKHVKEGRVVVCDRYVLDSAAHLRYRYGTEKRFRLQSRLIKVLSPRPLRAYLLDVPPEEALRRKTEQYDIDQMTILVRMYREERDRMGVARVDGTAPLEEICSAIAADVWAELRA